MMKKMPVWMRPLLADKRKLGVVAVLVVVMAVLWGRLLLAPAPRTAGAAVAVIAETNGSGANLALGTADADSALNSAVLDPLRYPVVYIDLPNELTRDVFALKEDRYQRLKPSNPEGEAKSQVEVVDAMPEAELVRRAARGLALQTTMLGETPRAMINGQLLSPGDKIEGFVLLEVRERHVVMQMRGIRIELGM